LGYNYKYPVNCLREDDGAFYAVYLGTREVVIVVFDQYGNKVIGKLHYLHKQKSDFGNLIVGQSLDAVKAVDPEGEYYFLFTGRNDTPRVSYHYTEDGFLISIQYDALNRIVAINEKLL
jgi:hypothetical protein